MNAQLVVNATNGVLANDFDAEGATLTATSFTSPANGTLTANPNGSFTYTPNNNFVGFDHFTYTAFDGTHHSTPTKVSISVGQVFSERLQGDERGPNNLLHTGALAVTVPFSSDAGMVYRADTVTPKVIVPMETIYTGILPANLSLSQVKAKLIFGSLNPVEVDYGVATLNPGTALRFAIEADASGLPTGMYDWTITLTAKFNNGSTSTTVFNGQQAVVNRTDSNFGRGWWLAGYDRLYPQGNGALLVEGNGDTRWFPKQGSQYLPAEGDRTYSTLSVNAQDFFILTDKWGNTRTYNPTGLLSSEKRVNDTANAFLYEHNANSLLTKITDQFGRETNLAYNTLHRITSYSTYGGRSAQFEYNSPAPWATVCPSGINWYDPNAGLQMDPPENFERPKTLCAYDALGRLEKLTRPGNSVESYSYDGSGRIVEIQHSDLSKWFLAPGIKEGLRFPNVGNNFVVPVSTLNARFTNELGNTFKFITDRFGNVTRFVDALQAETQWHYSSNSELYRLIEADPDGTDTEYTSPISKWGYNHSGDVVTVVNSDNTTRTYTYHATLHLVLTATNELNQTETYQYDAVGNMTSRTDAPELPTWTYEYCCCFDSNPNNRHELTAK
ncbi:MAG: cadherin-like domain-containing protein [Pirellulaceae bacterium]|nr:cadherin-like domain-containing protein [Pirellulaceae bacterium]